MDNSDAITVLRTVSTIIVSIFLVVLAIYSIFIFTDGTAGGLGSRCKDDGTCLGSLQCAPDHIGFKSFHCQPPSKPEVK